MSLLKKTLGKAFMALKDENMGDEFGIEPVYYAQTTFEQTGEFHEAFDHPFYNPKEPVREVDAKTARLRLKLILEEFSELCHAVTEDQGILIEFRDLTDSFNKVIDKITDDNLNINVVEVADALGDIKVVTEGAAHTWNIDLDAVSDEIFLSNMSKLGLDGKPIYNEIGKIMKPAGWKPPNIKEALGLMKKG